MQITRTASGKQIIKMSKSEWTAIGKKAGWMKKAQANPQAPYMPEIQGKLDQILNNIQSYGEHAQNASIKMQQVLPRQGQGRALSFANGIINNAQNIWKSINDLEKLLPEVNFQMLRANSSIAWLIETGQRLLNFYYGAGNINEDTKEAIDQFIANLMRGAQECAQMKDYLQNNYIQHAGR